MIPDCDDHGYLPPGIYPATLDQIAARFGRESELRQERNGVAAAWLVDLARRCRAAANRGKWQFLLTDGLEPNDVDCVLLIGPDFPRDSAVEAELARRIAHFINMELVDPRAFQQFTGRTFAADHNLVPKGMVEWQSHDHRQSASASRPRG